MTVLRAVRINSGLTLKQVADDLGTTAGHLGNVERGQANASPELQRRIETMFHAPLTDLLQPATVIIEFSGSPALAQACAATAATP